MNYTLGLDIGIASIGWAVLRNDENEEPCRIENLGVRVFDKAEQPKTGASLAAPRRQARSQRRTIRRRRFRKERIRNLITSVGLMSREDIEKLFADTGYEKDVYTLRAEGLDRLLEKEEWVRVLIHLNQRRGYRSNSKAEEAQDKETGAVLSALAENEIRLEKYRTIGEMFCKDEDFQSVDADGRLWRGTRNRLGTYKVTVRREWVEAEVNLLFEAQRKYGNSCAAPEFQEAYKGILFAQRNFDEGPGGNSPYSKTLDLRGNCIFEPDEKRAFKACYTFEYFKLLTDLNHIRLLSPNGNRDLTPEEREAIKEKVLQSENVKYSDLRKLLQLDSDTKFNRVSYTVKRSKAKAYKEENVPTAEGVQNLLKKEQDQAEKETKFDQFQSYHKIRKALDKVEKDFIKTLSPDTLDQIGEVLSLYKSDEKRLNAFEGRGITLPKEAISPLLCLSFSKAGSLSLTAMRKLIPELEKGITYDKACNAVYPDFRGHGSQVKHATISLNPQFLEETQALDRITNPVVFRAISQTCKVVNAIVRKYGSPQFIHLELAREMRKTFDERKDDEKENQENRKRNEAVKETVLTLKKNGTVSGEDIVKYKLFQDQKEICLYSGKKIKTERLFEPGYAEVDHIIPYSISFDNGYRNKVLVLTAENRQKTNQLPYPYICERYEEGLSELSPGQFQTLVMTNVRSAEKRRRLLKEKLTDEDKEGFRERNLTDTQYIARTVLNLFQNYLAFAPSKRDAIPTKGGEGPKKVFAVNGAITADMRKRFGLDKNREDGDLHHAMDAVVIGVTTDRMIQKITRYSQRREWARFRKTGSFVDPETNALLTQEEFDAKYSPKFPNPWPLFHEEVMARLSENPEEEIKRMGVPGYAPDEKVPPIFVSRMPRHKATGAAHKDTIFSQKAGPNLLVKKVSLTDLKLDKNNEIEGYYRPETDPLLYEGLKKRLIANGGDAKKAFKDPFYKPKKDGTDGPVVEKVKLQEKISKPFEVRNGIADNGDMLRIDVFHVKDDGYYFVPVYVPDTVKAELPNRAVIQGKNYPDWKVMEEENFLFSVYPGDLLYVEHKKAIKLKKSNKEASGSDEIKPKGILAYYVSAGIAVGTINICSHDRKYEQPSLGIKTLVKLEKYEVDPLGEAHKVRTPETRRRFR